MAISLQPTGSVGRTAAAHWRALSNYPFRGAARALAAAKAIGRTLQTARMMSVLANMSDQQLDEIGISRSDIPLYAERLMSND